MVFKQDGTGPLASGIGEILVPGQRDKPLILSDISGPTLYVSDLMGKKGSSKDSPYTTGA